MTKRDEAVFAKAFKKMDAKGYFVGLKAKAMSRSKAKHKSLVLMTAAKPLRKSKVNSVSSRNAAMRNPLSAREK